MSYGPNGDMSPVQFAEYIWNNKSKLEAELNKEKNKVLLYIEDRGYRPKAIFDALFLYTTKIASKDDLGNDVAPSKAILLFCKCKAEILSLTTYIDMANELNDIEPDNYSVLMSKIDSFIDWSTSELDTQLKDNQFETNKISKTTNTALRISLKRYR